MITAEQVKQCALESGADLVGIGDMSRFEGAPTDCDPRYIFPEAKSIIGLGFRVHRGLYRGIEEGTFFAALPSMGYANINDVYAPICLREVGDFIEDSGYEAVLYQNTAVRYGANRGVPIREGFPRPDVFLHFRIAAYICGMGEIGWSKVFITPRFGPRQRFAFIITDAELEPDPLVPPGTLCDRCKQCARDCPVGAISEDKAVTINIGGYEIQWGELDVDRCSAGFQSATREYNPFLPEKAADGIDLLRTMPPGPERNAAMAEYGGAWGVGRGTPYSAAGWESYHHPGAICGARGCQRACFIHLEERGVLENKFHRPFRLRKPWKLETNAEYTPATKQTLEDGES
ncbi:MAG: (4Fe-4S)-binding protein [Armatimonadetes bacterium]|nr:(4Fe-4S)-binding protein [Armatimonadota bacterium]